MRVQPLLSKLQFYENSQKRRKKENYEQLNNKNNPCIHAHKIIVCLRFLPSHCDSFMAAVIEA